MSGLSQEKDLLRKRVKPLFSNPKISIQPLLEELEIEESQYWALFKPLSDEPELINVPDGLKICWPYIKDNTSSLMSFSESEVFTKSSFGFEEPVQPIEIPKRKISVVLAPGQAFDFKGNRLGRGKGHFDRYTQDFDGILVGVCSKERFLMEPIPVDQKFDVAVQYILTEEFLYKVNPDRKVV